MNNFTIYALADGGWLYSCSRWSLFSSRNPDDVVDGATVRDLVCSATPGDLRELLNLTGHAPMPRHPATTPTISIEQVRAIIDETVQVKP